MAKHRPAAVGIDFGTSTSLVARRRPGQPLEILPIGDRRWLPSLVGRHDGRFVVGEDAERLAPEQVVRSIKKAITEDTHTVTFGPPETAVKVRSDELIVEILQELSRRSTASGLQLNRHRDLRLGCPAMWERGQRQRLVGLVEAAGIHTDALTLVEEPVAAGLAWIARRSAQGDRFDGRLLVFDMGGGTLDVAVLDVTPGDPPSVRVLTSVGLPLAGDALDDSIAADLHTELAGRGVDIGALRRPTDAESEIRRQAREAKVLLSAKETQSIVFARDAFGGDRVPVVRYSRDRLEEIFRPHMDQAVEMVWDALRLARLTHVRGATVSEIVRTAPDLLARDVHHVILAGGMSRIPYVKRRLTELLPHTEVFDTVGLAADETVVAGLTDTSDADPLNLYRPGFDVTLTWDDGEPTTLYGAYTPLFTMSQVRTMAMPNFEKILGQRDGIPRQRQGELRVSTPAGESVNLVARDKFGDTRVIEALPVPFGHKDLMLRLYSDGRVYFRDGLGHTHDLRVEPWPEIEGADTAPPPEYVPDPKVHYPFNLR